MKTSLKACLCRKIAAAFLGAGAFLLVATYLPVINPKLYDYAVDERGCTRYVALSDVGERAQPLSYYVIGTPLSLLLLSAAWHFNLKALRSRGEM